MNTLNGIENHISRLFNHLTQPFEWLFSLGLYSFHWAGYQSYIETLSPSLSLSLCKILNCALQGRRKVDDIFWGKEWLLVSVFTTFNPSKTSLDDKGSHHRNNSFKNIQIFSVLNDYFRMMPMSTSVGQGDTAVLKCLAPKGTPRPTTTWFKNGVLGMNWVIYDYTLVSASLCLTLPAREYLLKYASNSLCCYSTSFFCRSRCPSVITARSLSAYRSLEHSTC